MTAMSHPSLRAVRGADPQALQCVSSAELVSRWTEGK